jgi:hypothetical protein
VIWSKYLCARFLLHGSRGKFEWPVSLDEGEGGACGGVYVSVEACREEGMDSGCVGAPDEVCLLWYSNSNLTMSARISGIKPCRVYSEAKLPYDLEVLSRAAGTMFRAKL